jgi:hypothetical protein
LGALAYVLPEAEQVIGVAGSRIIAVELGCGIDVLFTFTENRSDVHYIISATTLTSHTTPSFNPLRHIHEKYVMIEDCQK